MHNVIFLRPWYKCFGICTMSMSLTRGDSFYYILPLMGDMGGSKICYDLLASLIVIGLFRIHFLFKMQTNFSLAGWFTFLLSKITSDALHTSCFYTVSYFFLLCLKGKIISKLMRVDTTSIKIVESVFSKINFITWFGKICITSIFPPSGLPR